MKATHYWPALIALLFAAGCGLDGPAPSDTKPAPAAPQAADNAGAAKSPSEAKLADTPAAAPGRPARHQRPAPAVTETKPSAAAPAEKKPGEVREQAHVGMGEKGRGYGKGLVGVTVASLWATKERTTLMMIQHDMDLYKAENGHFPRTHEEFWKEIVVKNDRKLPELPEGQKYEYDPETATLMVLMPPDPNGP